MIVMKFGGTSVESAAAIERVAGIVKARQERRPVVVVSAMGKTTNKLLAIAAAAIAGQARGIHPPDPRPARYPFARGAPGECRSTSAPSSTARSTSTSRNSPSW